MIMRQHAGDENIEICRVVHAARSKSKTEELFYVMDPKERRIGTVKNQRQEALRLSWTGFEHHDMMCDISSPHALTTAQTVSKA
jgi:hypothetical protein